MTSILPPAQPGVPLGTAGIGPVIWGNVPQRNKNFTGREDILAQLKDGLSRSVTVVLPRTLQGWGGVGKTAVAVEYAHNYRDDYELVWWIPADDPHLVRSSLAELAVYLGLPSATASTTGIENAAKAVLNALRRGTPFKRWLLIFDNADQPEDLIDNIPPGPGHVIITSRNHRWQSSAETIPVDVFTREESIKFLAKRVQGRLTPHQADTLASELGDLPLALEQAGALQVETGISVGEYVELLKKRVAAIMDEGKSLDYPFSMTAAWQISVSTLEQQLPEALILLRCCAFFGPEPIPRDLLSRGAGAFAEPLAGLLADPIKLARAIRELGRFALVRLDGRTIVVHRLIQALLRDALSDDDRTSYREQAHLILAHGAPDNPDDNRMWQQYSELVSHALAMKIERSENAEVRFFALNIVRYLYNSGATESARQLAERFISKWSANTSPTARELLQARHHLGNVLRDLGQYQAAYDLDEETLRLARDTFSERDEFMLRQTSSLSADLRARGQFSQALDIDRQALELHNSVFSGKDPRTLRVSNNLAVDYGLNSRYAEAREQHQKTYTARTEASPDIPAHERLSSWNGLARALRLCGDYRSATDVGQDAYDFGLEKLGPDHPRTLETAIDLSIGLRRDAASYDDAFQLAAETFDRSLNRFGPAAPLTLAAAVSLANIQRTSGLVSEALTRMLHVVENYGQIYGTDHPYYHGCRGNIAMLYRVNDDPERARRESEDALAGLLAGLGTDHHYTLAVLANLASDLAALSLHDEARVRGQEAYPRLRAVMGENHPLTLGCAANLAVDLRNTGNEVEAARLSADTLSRFQQTLGNGHADTITAAEGRRLDFDFDSPQI